MADKTSPEQVQTVDEVAFLKGQIAALQSNRANVLTSQDYEKNNIGPEIPGGRYMVDGILKNAHGDEIDETGKVLRKNVDGVLVSVNADGLPVDAKGQLILSQQAR
jgi:hypothetical protein